MGYQEFENFISRFKKAFPLTLSNFDLKKFKEDNESVYSLILAEEKQFSQRVSFSKAKTADAVAKEIEKTFLSLRKRQKEENPSFKESDAYINNYAFLECIIVGKSVISKDENLYRMLQKWLNNGTEFSYKEKAFSILIGNYILKVDIDITRVSNIGNYVRKIDTNISLENLLLKLEREVSKR